MSDIKDIYIAIGKHEAIAYAASDIDELLDYVTEGGTETYEVEFYKIEKASRMKLTLQIESQAAKGE